MTIIAMPPAVTPNIVCPSWCVVPLENHIADLPNLEGFVIHYSAPGPVSHSAGTFPDGTPDPTDPPQVFVEISDGLSFDEAEALARRILRTVEEARG